MRKIERYESDDEFTFNPTNEDWISTEPLLENSKPLRDDYRILSQIGQGSYSCVYKVENIHNGKIYAAKNYFPQRKENGIEEDYLDLSDHCKQELTMLKRLSGVSIVPICGIYRGRRRGSVYLITEMYDMTLDTLVIHPKLTMSEKKCILFQLLSLLSLLESEHIVHCDIKPNNVLIREGDIAVCDWGSATKEGECGLLPTLGYRSPELLLWREGKDTFTISRWTSAVDVWSWGVVVIELLSNQYLWNTDSELSVTNGMIRLAGTEDLSEEERVMFDEWCSAAHFRFPSIPSTLDKHLTERGLTSPLLKDLLQRCFCLMPWKRGTAKELLQHPWWREEPVMCDMKDLPDLKTWWKEVRDENRRKAMEMWNQLGMMLRENN